MDGIGLVGWLGLLPHSNKVLGFNTRPLCVKCECSFCVCVALLKVLSLPLSVNNVDQVDLSYFPAFHRLHAVIHSGTVN